jgi:hypothetical protein
MFVRYVHAAIAGVGRERPGEGVGADELWRVQIIKDHGDMSNRKFRTDKRVHLGALKVSSQLARRESEETRAEADVDVESNSTCPTPC